MKLEEEIKQDKFKSEYHKLVVNLMFTYNWLMKFQNNLFVNYGITGPQYNILRILRGQHPNPATINLLKERMLDKMSDTSRLVERLRVKGLVDRKICKKDRRRTDVKITEKALQILKELDHVDFEIEKLLSGISPSEAEALNNFLDKMRG